MKKLETNIETITIEQRLSVEELEKSSQHLANLVHEMENIEREQADQNKVYSELKKEVKAKMKLRADEVETAIRKTQVNVTRRQNTNDNVWEFVDEETGEILKREPYLLPPAPLFDIVENVEEEEMQIA